MLERLSLLVGEDKIEKLHGTRVLVVGVGGVGGYAVEALARSGIGYLYLIDHDTVEESNINRQIVALKSTLGKYKVDVLKERIEDMGLGTRVDVSYEFLTQNNLDNYLENIDYVVDACDTLKTKFSLIESCLARNIPFISCMGTGNKLDPSQLEITELEKTSYDPLAKKLRKMVKDAKLKGKIMVVSSKEAKQVQNEKVIPSNSFVPATAGMLCASYIVRKEIED